MLTWKWGLCFRGRRGRRPSPIWLSEEFFESNYFQIGQAVVLLLVNYIAREVIQLFKENYCNRLWIKTDWAGSSETWKASVIFGSVRAIFGSTQMIFGNLLRCSGDIRKSSEVFGWFSEVFGIVRVMFRNLLKRPRGNCLISLAETKCPIFSQIRLFLGQYVEIKG